MKGMLKLAVFGIAAIAVLSSCSKNEDVPSQKDIETKIIGMWKKIKHNGDDALTNKRTIWTFNNDSKGTQSMADYKEGDKKFIWDNKEPIMYTIQGNILHSISPDVEHTAAIPFINDNQMTMHVTKVISRGVDVKDSYVADCSKVTADYSQDIIGMWEGVEMTGDETYGDANHRIEYKADGTYVYYNKDGDKWTPSKNVGNEYNVDGDWLATRWQPTEGADYEYEWWDIVEIKDGAMKWSALREKEDKTRYTTTVTWKKVENPDKPFCPEWFETATPFDKDFVDVLFFAGTNIETEYDKDGNELLNITLTDAQKAKIADEYKTAWTLMCPDSVNFLAPYYHQATFSAVSNIVDIEKGVKAFGTSLADASKIFRYYMDNINGGRPFIIAGFCQGAMIARGLLGIMTDEEYSRMAAAYLIGYSMHDADLKASHVKTATGEFDKGVTIAFNSAAGAEGIWWNLSTGTSWCINPVNWKTDDTPATFKYDGMELRNHIDPKTHVLFVEGFDFVTHPSVLPGCSPRWPEHNLHVYEVRMYAPYLRKNIKDRAYR